MKSWKTTLGGLLSAIGISLKHEPTLAPYADIVTAIGVALMGLSARDNNVSSEQAGVKRPDSQPNP